MQLDIINPNFKIDEENNIFNIRKSEYDEILPTVREILKPAEEAGFELTDFEIKDSFSHELDRTLKNNLIIKLKRGESEIDFSMMIPKLIDDNFIVIKGNKKVPMFQLFDTPIVTRGENIKIRTNVLVLMIVEKKTAPYMCLSLLGAEVPIAALLFAKYGYEYICNTLNFKNNIIEEPKSKYEKLMADFVFFDEMYSTLSAKEMENEVGLYYNVSDTQKKGEVVLYALDIALKIDKPTAKFFESDDILSEILKMIQIDVSIDDTDVKNKRLRCIEYMIYGRVAKAIFDLCITAYGSKKVKFNINSSAILSDCTISNIVEYDFSINPINQLSRLTRCSLVGPGGFSKENIPVYLRDINPSMFGRICPVDTSDRENCGVLQHILPNEKLDENKRFTDERLDKTPISVAVSMVPSVEHDDPTRLQMAASQMRQAICLSDPDLPLVQSGCEGLYTNHTTFLHRAKKDGKVVYVDPMFIIVVYDDNTYDVFNVETYETTEENINVMNVMVEIGDVVKKGDIVAESSFLKNGRICIGKNLLTAVMPYYGYNYEDAIVVSDRLVKQDILTSVHHIDLSFILPINKILLSLENGIYKPLPTPNLFIENDEPKKDEIYYRKRKRELILKGQPYAIVKEIPDDPLNYCVIFEDRTPILSKRDVLITNVDVYPNRYNEEITQFKDWMEEKFENQLKRERKIQETIRKFLPKEEAGIFIRDNCLDKFAQRGKFKYKDEVISGTFISIHGIYTRKIEVGDKIGNRHGNKGVISKIVPHEKMPRLEDGRNADIVINPLGTISRMNVAQLFELHIGMSVLDLKKELLNRIKKGKSQKSIKKYFLEYIKIIDSTKDNWYLSQVGKHLETISIDEEFVNDLSIIQPPFESTTYENVLKACEYTNTPLEYKVHEPILDIDIVNKIGVGSMYFFRMVHIAENKIAARGIGSYSKKTMQPPGGRKNNGGQRCGEMETGCFIGHDGMENLAEVLTTKSDCIDLKNRYIREAIGSEFVKDSPVEDTVPESVKLLENYLKVLGLTI